MKTAVEAPTCLVVLGGEQRLDPIGGSCAQHHQRPGRTGSQQPSGQIPEPGPGADIGGNVRRIQVQGQRRPGPPPLAVAHQPGIEFPGIERIQPTPARADHFRHAQQHQHIDDAAEPGMLVEGRCDHGSGGWRAAALLLVKQQLVPRLFEVGQVNP
ncbi:MAG: hypothetical protein WDM77_08620 [Steroidobacteraceae bacterium]